MKRIDDPKYKVVYEAPPVVGRAIVNNYDYEYEARVHMNAGDIVGIIACPDCGEHDGEHKIRCLWSREGDPKDFCNLCKGVGYTYVGM